MMTTTTSIDDDGVWRAAGSLLCAGVGAMVTEEFRCGGDIAAGRRQGVRPGEGCGVCLAVGGGPDDAEDKEAIAIWACRHRSEQILRPSCRWR